MHSIAIIPARGGSKRIEHKNIQDFNGKPLVAYSIQVAIDSKLFDEVVVSTDDKAIADIALNYGASVPFLRDKNLSDDFTGTDAVTLDAVKKMEHIRSVSYDFFACIYATAPLLKSEFLVDAYKIFKEQKADYLYSCAEFPFPIQRAQYLDNNGAPHPFMPDCMLMRSQDLKKAYQDAGQFYFYSKNFLEGRDNLIKRTYQLPRIRVIDIDTPEDLQIAKALAKVIESL